MKERKVILVNQSSGYLMIDIVNAFTKKYGEVVLIAGTIKIMERPVDSKVKWRKIISYNRESLKSRLFSWIWGTIQIVMLLFFKYRQHEVVFVTNPPFAYLSAILLRRSFSVIVYDIYPDALRNIGIMANNPLFKMWSKLNVKIFRKSKAVFTLSESMANQLTAYTTKEHIRIIPNWHGSSRFKPISKKQNKFVEQQQLENKFIILYSGNIGLTHQVEVIIQVAQMLSTHTDICFLFIGDGKKKQDLIHFVNETSLNNCLFLEWQDYEILPYSLAAADLGVVTLNEETAMSSVPSKTYNLMASGVPLLTVSPETSELANLVTTFQNGKNFRSNQLDEIATFVINCKNDEDICRKMSENSLKASENFTYANANQYLI
jgi:hypothetical protein